MYTGLSKRSGEGPERHLSSPAENILVLLLLAPQPPSPPLYRGLSLLPSQSFTIFVSPESISHLPPAGLATMSRRPGVPPTAVAASPIPADRVVRSRFSDQSLVEAPVSKKQPSRQSEARRLPSTSSSLRVDPNRETPGRVISSGTLDDSLRPVINIASSPTHQDDSTLADELDFITVTAEEAPTQNTPSMCVSPNLPFTSLISPDASLPHLRRPDKASRVLGIRHRSSMEPVPASNRNSIVSTRSLRDIPPVVTQHVPNLPLTSLYVVSGLPKSPHTWTLADPDSVMGLHHAEGAVNRWWRPEVLGSTVSPGAGGGKKKRRGKLEEVTKGAGALSKQEVGKMLSKALKVGQAFT